ncbi:LOW QUALITY PROTEIN: hypothetical protein OSB04_020192 [Centaurea solstitialis]|uniref:Uncharacterized protein n=1 Tax=Centaurea solstitialis TaxID=347529 RepID=A0AA38SRR6_9ASTR|nr:LOW QUALITY PROTEIN: hypothetical protein OSB04_020192 [Centaurea solstitialis]
MELMVFEGCKRVKLLKSYSRAIEFGLLKARNELSLNELEPEIELVCYTSLKIRDRADELKPLNLYTGVRLANTNTILEVDRKVQHCCDYHSNCIKQYLANVIRRFWNCTHEPHRETGEICNFAF